MEKNQHTGNTGTKERENNSGFTGNQPGQQLPPDAEGAALEKPAAPEEKEQHSESSLPQQAGETLGTP